MIDFDRTNMFYYESGMSWATVAIHFNIKI